MGRPAGELPEELALKQIKPHHRSIARAVVSGGLRNGEIARLYGLSEGQVSRILNSPLFLAELARLEEDADDVACSVFTEFKLMAPRAVKIVQDRLLENPSSSHEKEKQTRTAFDVLDRAYFGKPAQGREGGGDTFNTQVNIDARNMSKEELRDNVFELLEED